MGTNLQRLDQIARPDDFDDQKTAAEIAASESTSADYAQFQEYVLSQIKRILYGDQTGKWYDDPGKMLSNSYKEVACLSGDTIGNCMRIRDVRVNGKWRVETADPSDRAKMPAVGVLISKSTPTVGIVQLFGVVDLFTEMVPGQPLLVGFNGELLDEIPTLAPGEYFWAQQIGVAVSNDLLMMPGVSSMTRYTG